jgi:RNA polymerase-binding transcription factor DksA
MAKTTTTKKKVVQKTAKPAAASKAKVMAAKKKTVKAKTAAAPVSVKKSLSPVKKKVVPVKKANAVNNSKKVEVKKTAVKKVAVKKAAAKKPVVKKVAVKKIEVKKKVEVKKTVTKKAPEKKAVVTKTDVKPKKIVKEKKEKAMPRKKINDVEAKTTPVTESAAAQAAKPVEGPMLQGKSVAHIKGYSKEELEQFKKIIMDKRDEILEQLQNLQEQMYDPSTGEYINENSPYSLHMAEQGTDAMEREKTFLYAQRENKFLGYLEEALKRIESGTYGICLDCIDNPQHLCPTCPLIPRARLEAVPHSQLCVEIKKKQERK